jgi:hypothetical protein
MNASTPTVLTAGLLLLGMAETVGSGGDLRREGATTAGATAIHAIGGGPENGTELNDLVVEYCVRCHNERRLRGDLSLERFDPAAPEVNAEIAERMIHKLRAGMMPPAGVRRPPEDSLALLATQLEDRLDELARHDPNPGRRSFQRLNRAEYEASIHDLFGIRIDASAYLPTETLSDNFDNIADTQILSATLLESYMRAAAQVSRDAVGDVHAAPSTTVYKVPKTVSQVGHVEGTPLGTRGGISVTHNFPADGDYVFELDMHPSPDGQLFGLTAGAQRMEVAVNGARVALLELDRWMSEGDPTGLRLETPPIHDHAVGLHPGRPEHGRGVWRNDGSPSARSLDQRPVRGDRRLRHPRTPAHLQLPPHLTRRRGAVRPGDHREHRGPGVPPPGRRRRGRGAHVLLRRGARAGRLRDRYPQHDLGDSLEPSLHLPARADAGRHHRE